MMPKIKEIRFMLDDGTAIVFEEPIIANISFSQEEVDINFESRTSGIKRIASNLEEEWTKLILKNN